MIRRPRSPRNSRSRLLPSAAGLLIAATVGCIVTGIPLDQAGLAIEIREDGTTAEITATLRSGSGAALALEDGQSVEINDTALTEQRTGTLTGAVMQTDSYDIAVREPTRGVFRDTVASPGTLMITTPADGGDASLGGFTLTWPVATDATVTITLRQTLLGTTTTETFGPQDDTGTQTFTAADLQDFRQGGDLEIMIDRTTAPSMLNGIDDGTVFFLQSAEVAVTPGP